MRHFQKVLLAIPVLYLLYFYGLTAVGMLSSDEPRYAAIGREMAISGDWITPRLWGDPWFEKPPLLYWMTSIGFGLGLDEELGPRLPVALLSVWFLVFYFLRMRREFGEKAAWFSASMLATSAGWLAYSHVAVTDLPLAATFSASMMLALPWVRSGGRRGLVFAGGLLGLAVLAKGLVPLVLALPLFWVGRRRWKELIAFCLVAILVAAPWYLLCYLRNGWPFFETFILRHHFSRFFSPELQHVQPWWFYIPVLCGLLFPWTPAIAALYGLEWREPRRLLLTGWFLFGFLFFTVSSNKLPGYILPLLPPMTAMIGIQMASQPMRLVLPASALLLSLTPLVASVLPDAVASGLSRASWGEIQWPAAVLLAAAAIGVGALEHRSVRLAFGVVCALATICVVWLISTVFPTLDRTVSARGLWKTMIGESMPLCADDKHRSTRLGLNYYARRVLPLCPDRDILDRDRGVPF